MISPGRLAQHALVRGRQISVPLYDMSDLWSARSTRSAVWSAPLSVYDYAYPLAGTDRPTNADPFAMLRACRTAEPQKLLTYSLSSLAASVVGRNTCPGTETETSP